MTYNPDDDFEKVVGSQILKKDLNENMNTVNKTDVTLMSLALADFGATTTYLIAHDYPVAAGLFVAGVVLVYLYHKLGSV